MTGIGQPDGGHEALRGLLGAWALNACPAEETLALEAHMTACKGCRDEGIVLRDAAGWLYGDEPLGPSAELRANVLGHCLMRRPPRLRTPAWAAPFDAEAARLDAMLRDLNESEWLTPVFAPWLGEGDASDGSGCWTVIGLLCHLTAGDAGPAVALGAADPVPPPLRTGPDAPLAPGGRAEEARRALRLAASWRLYGPERVRQLWREHSRMVLQGVALAGSDAWSAPVAQPGAGRAGRPPVLREALMERAFVCWNLAEDVAETVGQLYEPPRPGHVHAMLEHVVGRLPAARERAAAEAERAGRAGRGGGRRVVRVELEGPGGGEWLVPLDEPEAPSIPAEQQLGSADHAEVAHLVADGREFCRLAAGRLAPDELATGAVGDAEAVRELLEAAQQV